MFTVLKAVSCRHTRPPDGPRRRAGLIVDLPWSETPTHRVRDVAGLKGRKRNVIGTFLAARVAPSDSTQRHYIRYRPQVAFGELSR